MAHQVDVPGGASGPVAEPAAAGRDWYSRSPEEVAEAVVYLASPEAAWASGAVLDLNGASYLR